MPDGGLAHPLAFLWCLAVTLAILWLWWWFMGRER